MEVSDEGLKLIMSFEGIHFKAYQCPAKVWTIGYGHTGPEVTPGLRITREQAEAWLREDVRKAADCAKSMINRQLKQNELDALASLIYNCGCTAIRKSKLVRAINAGSGRDTIMQLWAQWDKVKGEPLRGLTRRRKQEIDLFFRHA